MKSDWRAIFTLGIAACAASIVHADGTANSVLKFDFTRDDNSPPTYTATAGYGFEAGPELTRALPVGAPPTGGYVSSEQPYLFSIDRPAGNHRVTATLAGGKSGSVATIKAESRRLMVERLAIPAGETRSVTFIVNTRTPTLPGGGSVRLKPREIGALHWDKRLTLEFNGERPALATLSFQRADDVPTLFLAGDSTVTDQQLEPYSAWGQMLPAFFQPTIAVANHAESGETIRSFVGERRFDRVLSLIKPGDFFFLQFGHNDQKQGPEHTEAGTAYKDLVRRFVREIRAKGATPVLVTSMERRNFDAAGERIIPSLAGYPQALRELSNELDTPLIDLNALSIRFYEALGAEEAKRAFVHFPAGSFPGQTKPLADDTHFSTYGAYELARAVVAAIQHEVPSLAAHLRADLPRYDPAHPAKFADWKLPASPPKTVVKPEGS